MIPPLLDVTRPSSSGRPPKQARSLGVSQTFMIGRHLSGVPTPKPLHTMYVIMCDRDNLPLSNITILLLLSGQQCCNQAEM